MDDSGETLFTFGEYGGDSDDVGMMMAAAAVEAENEDILEGERRSNDREEGEASAAPLELPEDRTDAEGLIPLCIRHPDGPQIDSAVFGYDIAELRKRPWTASSANLSDYFNYGFNERSWRAYCAMQKEGEASLLSRAEALIEKLSGVTSAAASKSGGAATTGDGANAQTHGGDSIVSGDGYAQPQQHAYHGQGGHHNSGAPHGQSGGRQYGARGVFHKTKLCQRFIEGRCTKGDQCNYAHGFDELRPAPQFEGGHSSMLAQQQQPPQQQQQQQQPQQQHSQPQMMPQPFMPFLMPPGGLVTQGMAFGMAPEGFFAMPPNPAMMMMAAGDGSAAVTQPVVTGGVIFGDDSRNTAGGSKRPRSPPETNY